EHPPVLRGLFLELPEGPQITRVGDHRLDGLDTERADELPLEVGGTDVDVLEHTPEQVGLIRIAEPTDGRTRWQFRDEAPDRVGPSDRDDLDALGRKVSAS